MRRAIVIGAAVAGAVALFYLGTVFGPDKGRELVVYETPTSVDQEAVPAWSEVEEYLYQRRLLACEFFYDVLGQLAYGQQREAKESAESMALLGYETDIGPATQLAMRSLLDPAGSGLYFATYEDEIRRACESDKSPQEAIDPLDEYH